MAMSSSEMRANGFGIGRVPSSTYDQQRAPL
jgi:hypothetical protein